MAEYQQILQLSDMPWEQGISPTIWQKPIWTRSDSNSHAQMMLVKMAPGELLQLIAIPIPRSSM
jgi:hypothetical protein